MSKRKREDDFELETERSSNQALRIKVSRLKARFDHGVQQLTAQLKLARGFDRQKMTRRIKQATGDEAKLIRLQAEVQVLKDLSEAKVAKNYLFKQCFKTKRIAESDVFKALFGKHAAIRMTVNPSVAENNVFGRLFKSNPVNGVLPSIMKGIREVLDVDKPVATKQSNLNDVKNTGDVGTAIRDAYEEPFHGFSDHEPTSTRINNTLQQLEGPPKDDFSNTNQSDLDDQYESRLAASSEDDSDEEEANPSRQPHNRSPIDDMEITTDDDAMSDAPYDTLAAAVADTAGSPTATFGSTTTAKQTAFLPSLMMGGYYSGSDSEDDPGGYDPDKAFAASAKIRKNRRGQRERQKIAELKFGARAQHLLKAKGAQGVHGDRQKFISGPRDGGWDAKRGAVDSSARGPGHGRIDRGQTRSGKKDSNPARSTNGVKSKASTSTKESSTTKLHPSWEAAKKRKAESSNVGANAFAGKKITFD